MHFFDCAASVAHFSTHPLARAIVAEAEKRKLPINHGDRFSKSARAGHGSIRWMEIEFSLAAGD